MSNPYPMPENRPTPVLDAQKITAAALGLFGAVVTLLAAFGVVVNGDSDRTVTSILTAVGTVLAIALPIIQAKRSARLVTPTSDPRDDAGNALRPVGPPTGR